MARPLRIEHARGHYHVTARGVGQGAVFFGDQDAETFLGRLAEYRDRWNVIVHGYALMTRHYHADIETPEGNLSRIGSTLH